MVFFRLLKRFKIKNTVQNAQIVFLSIKAEFTIANVLSEKIECIFQKKRMGSLLEKITTRFQKVTRSDLTLKMAESSQLLEVKNAFYFCSTEHVSCDMASTDQYRLMHVPVHLFCNVKDKYFLTYHYHVST